MRTKRKIRRTILLTLLILITLAGVVFGGYFVVIKGLQAAYDAEIQKLYDVIATNTKDVYYATVDIKAGNTITEDMVCLGRALCINDFLFTELDIGKVALVDIPCNTMMTSIVVTDKLLTPTSRSVEYTCFNLSSSVKKGDYVDIRIRYNNGEDLVVLSKKLIEAVSLASMSCYLSVDEVEMQLIASAIVDCSRYQAVLYTTTYVQPSTQQPTAVSYLPRYESLALIKDCYDEVYTVSIEKLQQMRGELELRIGYSGGNVDVSNFSRFQITPVSNINGTGVSINGDYNTNTSE